MLALGLGGELDKVALAREVLLYQPSKLIKVNLFVLSVYGLL